MGIKLNLPPDPPETPSKTQISGQDTAATIARTGVGMAAPIVTRIGSSLLSIPASKIPGVGTLAAGAIGAGGEALAQMIENRGTDKKINWPRVAVEGGISALPIGGEGKVAKALTGIFGSTAKAGAAKGAALAATGMIGRKATDDDPNTSALNPIDYLTLNDGLQMAIGTGIGAKVGGKATPKAPPVPATPEQEAASFLTKLGLGKPDAINTEIARLEAGGSPIDVEQANKIREAARIAKRGNEATYTAITKNRATDVAQQAKNASAAGSAVALDPEKLPSVDEIIARGPKAAEDIARRAEAQHAATKDARLAQFAKDIRSKAVSTGMSSSTTSNAVVRGEKAATKEAQEASRLAKVEAEKERLLAEGHTPKTSFSKSTSAPTADGSRQTVSTRLVPPAIEEGGEEIGGALPKTPVPPPVAPPEAPLPTTAGQKLFDIIDPTGKVVRTIAGPDFKSVADTPLEDGFSLVQRAPKAPSKLPRPTVKPEEPKLPFNPPTLTEAPVELPKAPEPTPAPPKAPKPLAEAVQSAPDPDMAPPSGGYPQPRVGSVPPVGTAVEGSQEAASSLWKDALARMGVGANNPANGQPLANIGMYDPARGGLQLQPKEGGGWIRDLFSPKGIEHSETVHPTKVGNRFEPDALDLDKVRADLDNIQDPMVRAMAERELGKVPEGPVPSASPSLDAPQVTHQAPQAILEEVANFKQRLETALNAAGSPEEAQSIANSMAQEAHDLQLKLTLAERAVGEGGAIDPEMAARIGLGLGGAAIGGAVDKKDRLRGMLLGGAAGAMAPSLLKLNTGITNTGEKIDPLDWLGNYQRFSLLLGMPNLPINAVAPVGGGVMSSIEKMLVGKLGGNDETYQLGKAGLGQLMTPSNYTPSALKGYYNQAQRLIAEADQGRGDMAGGAPNTLAKMIRMPADVMTTGDTGTRMMLEKGNWTDEMAREATLTNENRYRLTKALSNIPRTGGSLARFMFPFVKTAGNALEGSAERVPGLGMFLKKAAGNPEIEATTSELWARQGMGGAVGLAAYELGSHMDPETAKNTHMNLVITNMAGQYGPLAAAAFAAGQAKQNGGDIGGTAITHFLRDLPLPTVEAPTNLAKTALSYAKGEPPNPNAATPIRQWLPTNLVPRAVLQATDPAEDQPIVFRPLQ